MKKEEGNLGTNSSISSSSPPLFYISPHELYERGEKSEIMPYMCTNNREASENEEKRVWIEHRETFRHEQFYRLILPRVCIESSRKETKILYTTSHHHHAGNERN